MAVPAQTASAPLVRRRSARREMEKFLLDGKIIKKKESSKGVTEAYRVTLTTAW